MNGGIITIMATVLPQCHVYAGAYECTRAQPVAEVAEAGPYTPWRVMLASLQGVSVRAEPISYGGMVYTLIVL